MGTVPLLGTVTPAISPPLGRQGSAAPWAQELIPGNLLPLCAGRHSPNWNDRRALPEAARGGLRPQEGVLAVLVMTLRKRAASRWQH